MNKLINLTMIVIFLLLCGCLRPSLVQKKPLPVPPDEISVDVNIQNASQIVYEDVGTAQVVVSLSTMVQRDVTVNFVLSDGTALAGSDYTTNFGSAIIPAGYLSYPINVLITDDVVNENSEYFYFSITSVSGGNLGAMASQTVVIAANDSDNKPEINFISATQTASESAGIISATVQLSAISGIDIDVPFTLSGSAASSGVDYAIATGTFSMTAGIVTDTVTISIVDDGDYELDESIVLSLGTISDATLGSISSHSVTIEDDELRPAITITSTSSILENDITTFVATVSITSTCPLDTTASISLSGSTAVLDTDFTLAGVDVLIPAGSISTVATLQIINDAIDETDEMIEMVLTNLHPMTAGSTLTHTASVTIVDDDAPPVVSFSPTNQAVSEVTGYATVSVAISGVSAKDITVPITLSGTSTATYGATADHMFSGVSLLIPAGNTTTATSAMIVDDTVFELNETIILEIGAPTNATVSSDATHTITIVSDDATPTLTVYLPTSQSEWDATTITASLTLSATSEATVTGDLLITGTATEYGDYTISATNFIVAANELVATVTIALVNDDIYELDETLVVTATNLLFATMGASDTLIILNDEATPSLTITGTDDVSEGSAGPHMLTISVNGTTSLDITATLQLTGTATEYGDYTISATSFYITAGTTTATVALSLIDNVLNENDETIDFSFNEITNATDGATLLVTIRDDDATVDLNVTATSSITEVGGEYVFTITLSASSGLDVSGTISTSGSATLSSDYTISKNTFDIVAGDITDTVTVSVIDDQDYEQAEFIILDATSILNANAVTSQASTSIVNDDAQPVLSITANSTFSEDGSAYVVTVNAGTLSYQDITATLTATGSALNVTDYTLSGTAISILAGSSSATASITIIDDTIDEIDETVSFYLTAVNNASFTTTVSSVIIDADAAPVISITASSSITETSTGPHLVTISIDASSSLDITATLSMAGTALEDIDYTVTATEVSIPAGSMSTTASFVIVSDSVDEADETIIMSFDGLQNATLGASSTHTVTIIDDDITPIITLGGTTSVVEGQGIYVLEVILDATSGRTVSADINAAGTATNVDDYSLSKTTFSVAIGSLSDTVTVNLVNDTLDEDNETLQIYIDNLSNAIAGNATVSTTINDDDPLPEISFSVASQSVLESASEAIITFNLDTESSKDVTVYWEVGGTASAGSVDHDLVDGNETIVAGNTQVQKTIVLTDDYLTEGTETIIITVTSALTTNASVSSPSVHTVNLTDDDELKLALGDEHSCVLFDGKVKCWGDNSYGQLGWDTSTPGYGTAYGDSISETATLAHYLELGTGLTARDITAGAYHTCVRFIGGKIKCFGFNNHGQLGYSDTDNRGENGTVDMGDNLSYIQDQESNDIVADEISSGGYHNCVKKSSDEVVCWGQGTFGQLGNGGTADVGDDEYPPATAVTLDGTPVAVESGKFHTCVNLNNLSTQCFGYGTYGALGNDNNLSVVTTATTPVVWDPVADGVLQWIFAGNGHNCVSFDTDNVKCWGYNSNGELGLNDILHRGNDAGEMAVLPQVSMPVGGTIGAMGLGNQHTCVLIATTPYCWGDNSYGQLGINTTTAQINAASSSAVLTVGGVTDNIFAGMNHTCAVTGPRSIKCWGRNNKGQIGVGDTESKGSSASSPNSMGDLYNHVFP